MGGTHAPNLNDAPPRFNQQHHLHLTVIMRSQGSSPTLRCVQADSEMPQTGECKSIWIWLSPGLDQLGEDQISVPAAFFTQRHNRTHTRIPHGWGESRPKQGWNTGCHREKTWRKMSTPRRSSLVPPPTPTFSQEVVSAHMRGGGSIRIADCLIGGGGQNELPTRMR